MAQQTTDIAPGPHFKVTDNLLSLTALRLIPRSVSPNLVTTVRFISVPVVIALLLSRSYAWGTAVFAVSAFTDALDGAMARTRNQITRWGEIADPLADKLLIGTTALILVTQYMYLWTALLIVCIELLLATRAAYMYAHKRKAGANIVGKTKMIFQSIALLALFGYALSGGTLFLVLATWGIYLSIFLALVSLFVAPSV